MYLSLSVCLYLSVCLALSILSILSILAILSYLVLSCLVLSYLILSIYLSILSVYLSIYLSICLSQFRSQLYTLIPAGWVSQSHGRSHTGENLDAFFFNWLRSCNSWSFLGNCWQPPCSCFEYMIVPNLRTTSKNYEKSRSWCGEPQFGAYTLDYLCYPYVRKTIASYNVVNTNNTQTWPTNKSLQWWHRIATVASTSGTSSWPQNALLNANGDGSASVPSWGLQRIYEPVINEFLWQSLQCNYVSTVNI